MIRKSSKEKSNTDSTPTFDKSDDFLLTEYKESAEAWRFTDEKIKTTINFYSSVFIASAPILAGLYYFWGGNNLLWLFIMGTIIIDCCLIGMGLVAIQIITNSDFRKAEYMLSIQLIRRYFADKNPTILPYLYSPVANPIIDKVISANQIKPSFNTSLATGINAINSILTGYIISGAVWLLTNQKILFEHTLIIGFIIALVSFIVFHTMYKRKTEKFSNGQEQLLIMVTK